MDEPAGLAAKRGRAVVSGHFAGNLTAPTTASGGTEYATIWNSNVDEGDVPDDADQFHPNQRDAMASAGVDDGFVIKLDVGTGLVDWMAHYPSESLSSPAFFDRPRGRGGRCGLYVCSAETLCGLLPSSDVRGVFI